MKRIVLPGILLCSSLLVAQPLRARATGAPQQFERISMDRGLSQSTVLNILEDHKGFKWFCAPAGLNKYDGYAFLTYTHHIDDSASLSTESVSFAYEDRNRILWVGTFDGTLHRFNRQREKFTRFGLPAPVHAGRDTTRPQNADDPVAHSFYSPRTITSIVENPQGELLVGTWGQGLYRFVREDSAFHAVAVEIPSILDVLNEEDDRTWIASYTQGVLHRPVPGAAFGNFFAAQAGAAGKMEIRATCLLRRADGELWIGTFGQGILRIDAMGKPLPSIRSGAPESGSIADNRVMALLEDRMGLVWVGTFGGGLDKLDPNSLRAVRHVYDPRDAGSLSGNEVLDIYEDRAGLIWVGTQLGKGISKLDRNQIRFDHFQSVPGNRNSLNDNVIWALRETGDGVLWIGTHQGGLNRFADGRFSSRLHDPDDPDSPAQNQIRALAAAGDGGLWLGTFGAGLDHFDPASGKFQHHRHFPDNPSSLSDNRVRAILETADGNTWVGTWGGGLNRLGRDGRFTRFRHDPSDSSTLSSDMIRTVAAGSEGRIWIGTWGGGANAFDTMTGRVWRLGEDIVGASQIRSEQVIALLESRDGTLWIGTNGRGLVRVEPELKTARRYLESDGLADNVIYGILEANDAGIWLSTDNGICMLEPATGRFRRFDETDGLQGREFSGGASFRNRDGWMYFGGVNGFNRFHPDSVRDNTTPPQVEITAVKVFNDVVAREIDSISLPHDSNFVSIEFAALDMTRSAKNRYAYRLMPLETRWRDVSSSHRYANYTDLDPGRYTFHVRGANNDGVWNHAGARLAIEIRAPFWLQWWFFALTAAVLITLGWILYTNSLRRQIRMRLEREQIRIAENEKVRKQVAEDFHDELGHKLTHISLFSELAKRNLRNGALESTVYLEQISETSKTLASSIAGFIWALDPQRDALADIGLYLKDAGDDLFRGTDTHFWASELPPAAAELRMPMHWRRHITHIFKEAMRNALRHANAENVRFQIICTDHAFCIELKDDGVGFDTALYRPGQGMRTMRERAKKIGCKLAVQSNPEAGTVVQLKGWQSAGYASG